MKEEIRLSIGLVGVTVTSSLKEGNGLCHAEAWSDGGEETVLRESKGSEESLVEIECS